MSATPYAALSQADLESLEVALSARYREAQAANLALDLTRGKPSPEQLDLADGLDGILGGNFRCADGTDARNYGALDGIPEMKRLAADFLGVEPDEILVGGNGSLSLMYHYVLWAYLFGPDGRLDSAWSKLPKVTFLCPVPGYDRHFAICEELGIEMRPVPLGGDGPDMDRVEAAIRDDCSVRGMWCVPQYSNPTGESYSDEVVDRVARLGLIAGPGFRVMWDNAYSVHDLTETPPVLKNVMEAARAAGTAQSVVLFGSTSKITHAGAGIGFMGASRANLAAVMAHLSRMTIGYDKLNQLRHVRFLRDLAGVRAHMRKHARLLGPKFECVERKLSTGLGGLGIGRWTRPAGGYFVSFHTLPGLASNVVRLAAEAGVKLTPAGAAYPYGRDPDDSHIRLAPTFPRLDDVDKAMEVFVTCVRLASVRQRLGFNR